MRWRPIVLDVAVAIVLWVTILGVLRQRRARIAEEPVPAGGRSRRLHELAAISATVGATWFIAWFVTDTTGPGWLHTLSVRAALAFIAVGALVAGYAGWVGGP